MSQKKFNGLLFDSHCIAPTLAVLRKRLKSDLFSP